MSLMTHCDDRALPGGVVTFLMTDVEDSGANWSAQSQAMAAALRELDEAIGEAVDRHDGSVIKARGEGDSHFAVFARPSQAVLAACELQAALRAHGPGDLGLRVRIAIHTGEIDPLEGDYYGVPVNQTARLRSLAHGQQVVVSRTAARLAEHALADQVRCKSLGHHKVRDFPRLEEIFQATLAGWDDEFPPLRTEATRGPAVITVVLVDVCRSRERAIDESDAELAAAQRRWNAAMRRLGEAYRAMSLKLLGDGCLLAFEDPIGGLAFAQELRGLLARAGSQVRSGIATGRVELVDGEVIGHAVFIAAELCRVALPGQIVVTAQFREFVGGGAGARRLDQRQIESATGVTECFAV
jgi:class 3 adenylate cyclase